MIIVTAKFYILVVRMIFKDIYIKIEPKIIMYLD